MTRLAAFVAFVIVVVAAAGTYVVRHARSAADSGKVPSSVGGAATARSQATLLEDIRSRDHVYYRSARADEFGRVVVADLQAPDDRRVLTPLRCDRVAFGRERGVCLADTRGPAGPAATVTIVDRDFRPVGTVQLPGVPIRARLSPDERIAAATVFVTGERYDADFTTRTALIDAQSGTLLADLEQFTTTRDGGRFNRVDFNFWGVTFARDSHRFFATLGFTGTRLLVSGSVDERTLQVVRDNVECPSLSPDERFIAFKARTPGQPGWRLHALEVESGREWPLAGETRSIDDQVEWLDGGHVLYQFVADRGLPEQAMNVWRTSAVAGAPDSPSIFIRAANSPSVVRR